MQTFILKVEFNSGTVNTSKQKAPGRWKLFHCNLWLFIANPFEILFGIAKKFCFKSIFSAPDETVRLHTLHGSSVLLTASSFCVIGSLTNISKNCNRLRNNSFREGGFLILRLLNRPYLVRTNRRTASSSKKLWLKGLALKTKISSACSFHQLNEITFVFYLLFMSLHDNTGAKPFYPFGTNSS